MNKYRDEERERSIMSRVIHDIIMDVLAMAMAVVAAAAATWIIWG